MKTKNHLKVFLTLMACLWAFPSLATDWTGSAPTDGGQYYLYNVGAQKFLAHGANWGTRAIMDEAGILVTLESLGNGVYNIKTNVNSGNGKYYFGSNYYTDADAWGLTFVEASTGVYYLTFVESNVTKYLMITDTGDGTFNKVNTTNAGSTWSADGLKWMLITKAERDQKLSQVEASDTNPYDITYKIENNRTSWFRSPYSNADPFGFGSLSGIGNVSGGVDAGSAFRDANAQAWTGAADISWDAKMTLTGLPQGKYRFYVTGYYRDGGSADRKTNYDAGTFDARAKIYMSAGTSKTTDLQSIAVGASETALGGGETVDGNYRYPNNQEAAAYYFYNNKYPEQYVDGVVDNTGVMTFGVKVDNTIANNWLVCDKFRLEYRGPYHGPADGGKYYLYNVGAKMFIGHGDQWGYHALQDEAGLEMTLEETDGKYRIATGLGYLGSDGYCDKGANSDLAVSYEFVPVEGVDNAYYLKFIEGAEKYLLFTNDGKYINKSTLATGSNYPEGYSQWKLYTKAERDAMLESMVGINGEPVTEQNPLDISYKIPNNHTAYYTRCYSTDDPFAFRNLDAGQLEGVDDGGTLRDRNAQGWTNTADRKWDANMTFSGLPEGKYRFYVTGFYRDGAADGAYARYTGGTFDPRAKIYMTTTETTTTDLQSIGVGASASALGGNEYNQAEVYIPNGQNGAAYYFFNGKYPEQYVEGTVGMNGQLKIGLKVDKTIAGNWLVVDKVRLEYLGPDIPTTNVTNLLVNPTFDGTDGWTTAQGDNFTAATETVAENFATTFDMYQDVSGLEPGVYKISVQGFYRNNRATADGGDHGPGDVARNVRVIGNENLNSYLFARVGDDLDNSYTEGKNSLLSIFDLTAGSGSGTSILPTVPNTMAEAHTAFESGYYTDNSMIVEVTNSGLLRVGIKKETTTDRDWTSFDNMKLYKLDCTLAEALALEFESRSAEAAAVLQSAEYANVPTFSTERQALDAAVSVDASGFTTPYQYYAVLDALRPALNAFKASKYWYDRFVGVYEAAIAVGVDVTGYSTISMGQVPDAIKALVVATETAVNTAQDGGDDKYGDCTEVYLKGWTVQQFNTASGQHWDGTTGEGATDYYDRYGDGTFWYMSQTVALPAGEYVLKVAGRAGLVDNIQQLTVTFGNKTVHLPTLGGGTPGIATTGEANYNAGSNGWEWRYVPFTVTTAGNYEIRIAFEKDNVTSWASVADVQLLGSKEALAEGLLLLADKLREKIEEIDKAYYGSPISEVPGYQIFTDLDYNGHTYWEKNVAEMFQTKNTENTYDQRQSYVYDYDNDGTAESVTASSASTAIGLVNYYNLMHGAVLSTADYRKAMLVMQTKIDMAASNAASYVYTRRALLRAETFANLQGDIYENNATAVANLQTALDNCKATLKHAIALASGTDGTLDTQQEIVDSWDDNTHWIADNIKTSGLYKQALDEIKAATREFIGAITVNEGKALNITDVFLYNPSFDYNNPDGWTANGSTRPHNCNTDQFAAYVNSGYADVTTTYVNHYVEFYEMHGNPGAITGNYNSFQTVTGLPAGVYKFTATGSYRQLTVSSSAPERALGNEDITAEIYASGTHMEEVPVEYTVVEETGEYDDEGNPITQEVTYTRMEQRVIIDTDRSMPLFSLYKEADQTGLVEGLYPNDITINTVYGAVPVNYVNYMPVVHHYDGNTVMFGVTATDGSEDVTVGVRDNSADLREHSWAVLDNFELFYISPNIVDELSDEWAKRVELAQADFDNFTSPQDSKYGVALANYLNDYDPTTAIADSELGVDSEVLSGLTTAQKNELKYNKALRDLHVAQNDYEAATYWFDQLAAANAVANSFPYVMGVTIASDDYAGSTENISYDDYNVMLESPVDANTTMENARDKSWAVRTLADGLFGTGATNYYDVDLTSNLGELTSWTVGTGSKAIASSTNQMYKDGVTKIEPEACYDDEGWKFNISKTVTLEKGLYMFKIAARRSGGVTKCDIKVSGANVGTFTPVANSTSAYSNYSFIKDSTSFSKGDVTIAVPRSWSPDHYNGDTGYGIAADGTTNYTAGNNYGWQWEYIPFVVAKGSDVTITIDAESKSYYTWASFAEAQLWQGPIPTSVNENQDWDLEKCYANAHVSRKITNTTEAKTWGTIVLPYNKPLPDGWDIRQQVSKNESQDSENNNIIDFQRPKFTEDVTGEDDPSDLSSLADETIVINKPYIIQVANAVANPWSDNRVQINPAAKPYTENTYVEMIGMYNPGEIAIGDFYIAQNVFWRVTVKPQATKGLRVYFHVKENNEPDPNYPDPEFTANQVRAMLMGYDVKVYDDDEQIVSEDGGFVDGIDSVNGDDAQGDYYDLQGRRVSTPRHGVYIQNGKKRVVK
ncbi:MAG: hypothetical protein IKX24_02550 [Prevotella sp.]|nr:hypothetical protein [Prevotella sp.]